MKRLDVVHHPRGEHNGKPGDGPWREWNLEEGRFVRHYGSDETCYILEGEASLATDGGSLLEISAGDHVSVPCGLSCTWTIRKKIRALYKPCPFYNTFI